MRIASRWAKTGSLKVLGDTQHPWQHVLRLGHIQATRRCRGMRDRAVWQAVWNSACISLYFAVCRSIQRTRLVTPPPRRHTAIQRHTALYEHTAIQHHTAYTPYNTPQLDVTYYSGSSRTVLHGLLLLGIQIVAVYRTLLTRVARWP